MIVRAEVVDCSKVSISIEVLLRSFFKFEFNSVKINLNLALFLLRS